MQNLPRPHALACIVADSMGRSPMPELSDPAVRERARGIAESQGLIERILRELKPDEPIPALRRSDFREFVRKGGRGQYDPLHAKRKRQINDAAVAVWLGVGDYLDYLQDLLWAECENTWWISPAHEHHSGHLDLRSTMTAAELAAVVGLLGERLEAEVRDRLVSQIRTRVLGEYLDPERPYVWWEGTSNNWNAVCHGGIAIAAMLLETNRDRLARILNRALAQLHVFIDGFTDDGGCTEGPGYWRYGFGWYVKLAAAVFDFTDGRIDLMADGKVARVCRYPLAVTIRPGQELTFADASSGYMSTDLAIRINRFHRVPELFGLCHLRDDGQLPADNLETLLIYDGAKHEPATLAADTVLPDLGVAMVRGAGGAIAVGAKAGNNDEHHNHNDVGTFLVHKGDTDFLCDPGGPKYSARTFSEHRYESVFTSSFGHCVPVINGQLQSPGPQFRGTLKAEGLNAGGDRVVRIGFADAYDEPSLQKLLRTITLPADGQPVTIVDELGFSRDPASLEEGFLTKHPAEADADGRSVRIDSDADGAAVLSADADTPGRFSVAELTKESEEDRHGALLRRIAFVPDAGKLAKEMTLRFTVTFR